ncbi:hypothetical protein [Clostridium tyrobutyricum]|uniref:hypothetical protein n=1 Tax=Clostridium tyrobutyricum TaxID=1519 RepID=UPI0020116B1C|nr:hypothetical protein [Clostridium tyrobutyricum]MBR9648760.1 hypothetical protein [Clostridium tyrobutyricum]
MKISQECWHCGCEKLDYEGDKYCVFDAPSGPTIMKDEPDKCLFVDESSNDFKKVYTEFQKKIS